ncbi:DUF5965 family protein [Streptococcus caprae]|uniref:DUF5965 family protein n=1 Tax=Streptococcus caprae TaxID=1640501 RepID=A0ABV8CYD8_9STRE
MSLSQVARLEEKVAKQIERVNQEQERLTLYQDQLQKAMFATFISYQAGSNLRFDKALEQAFGAAPKAHNPSTGERRNET